MAMRLNFDPEFRARHYPRRRMSFQSSRGKVEVSVPGRVLSAIEDRRWTFPRRGSIVMSMADAITYVLQSCPEV